MKHFILILSSLIVLNLSQAQSIKGLLSKAKNAVAGKGSGLGNDDIISGLKEALSIGAEKGTAVLSKEDGFFKNEALKILMPAEAQKVEKTLRSFGLGKQVDDAIFTMNRGAEDAVKQATPIFISAIKDMSVQDALGLLNGQDTAATGYLRNKTTTQLTTAFKPIIEASLEKVGATKYWATAMNSYNKFSPQKINPDLTGYVTEKALQGIFLQIAIEEKNIRHDPVARVTDILKKVFTK